MGRYKMPFNQYKKCQKMTKDKERMNLVGG